MTGPVWDGRGRDPWLPARLDARLEAATVERSIREVVWAALSDWLVRLSRRVLRGEGRMPDMDAVWAMAPLWRDAVDLILQGEILKAIGVAFAKVLGPDYRWTARPFVTAYLAEVRNRLVRVPEEVYDLVAGEVAKGVNLGESIPKLAARVDSVLSTTQSERWPNRATVIARTETIGALNAGRADAFRVVADDSDEELFNFWLCVLPGTPVVANGVQAVARRWYDGQIWELRTATGRRVSLTPQHPVLTARGWIAAQDLQLGDQLLSVREVDPVGTPGVQGRYALIEECFQTAAETREVRTLTREVPGCVDLNSDLAHEQVDVVTAYGHLSEGVEPGIAEDLARLSLKFSDQALAGLVVEGALPHGVLCDHHARFSDAPGGFKATLTCAVPLDPDDPGGALVAHRDVGDTEHTANRVTASAELSAEAVDRTSGLVELDDLIGIEVRTWSGHVYDFTTYCHWFMADGIVVHNSTADHRTRLDHRLAEGQRVPVGTPFQVGGHELRFPGDPLGPANQTIQCRCTMLLVDADEDVDLSNRQMRTRR